MAKLANLNNGNAPTTMARGFGHLLRHVYYNENVPCAMTSLGLSSTSDVIDFDQN